MDYTIYSGNWIACGSYALIHAADLRYNDLIPLENSTGASFGISSKGLDYGGTRMLSVFRDFHYGIDKAAPLWGIQMNRVDGTTKEEIKELMRNPYIDRIVIGPVSMVGLVYLPLSQQYRCADHFIACIRKNKDIWQVIDSEGVPGILLPSEKIINMLSIQNIPEACGRYTARAIINTNASKTAENRDARIRYTLETACVNLRKAREEGQGHRAFQKCKELVRNMTAGNRVNRIPLIYDVDYLIQRKIMLLKLLQEAEHSQTAAVSPGMIAEIDCFIETAGALRGELNYGCAVSLQLFDRLAASEDDITLNWEEWIKIW